MHNLTPFHQKIRFENQVIVNSDCIGVCHGLPWTAHVYQVQSIHQQELMLTLELSDA